MVVKPPHIDVVNLGNATFTVTVRVTRRFRVRIWLGERLMLLAAWVMPADVRVFVNSEDEK